MFTRKEKAKLLKGKGKQTIAERGGLKDTNLQRIFDTFFKKKKLSSNGFK